MKLALFLGSSAGGFFAACAFALVHPFGNPRTAPAEPRAALLSDASIPERTKAILRAKCADCHSLATHWPIYARVAPMSWLVERDVLQGRQHMNLSEWHNLTQDQQQSLLQQIVHEARRNAMPPIEYRLAHRRAALTPYDQAALAALAPDGQTSPGAMLEAADPVRGKSVFERKCTGCHALDANREGPHLRNVYGRRAGSVPGFTYSNALKNSGLVWDESSLERWLEGTDAAVPNSAMGFSVPKAQDRADIIAFLKSLR